MVLSGTKMMQSEEDGIAEATWSVQPAGTDDGFGVDLHLDPDVEG
jgi:hypothetical protein